MRACRDLSGFAVRARLKTQPAAAVLESGGRAAGPAAGVIPVPTALADTGSRVTVPVRLCIQPPPRSPMSSLFGSSGAARKSNYNKADDAGASREERMNRLKFELREHIRFLAGQSANSGPAVHGETISGPRAVGMANSVSVAD